jgi:uncharacterized RDD family membrane protein YckC
MNPHVDPIPVEARGFQGRRAGLVTRAAAAAVDLGVVALALVVAYGALVVVGFLISRDRFQVPIPSLWLGSAVGLVAMTLYLTIGWHNGGRTYGCHVMGLRVVDRRGGEPGVMTALLRAVFDVLFPVGLAWVVVSRQNRSVQDAALRTSVIYDWDAGPRLGAPTLTRSGSHSG